MLDFPGQTRHLLTLRQTSSEDHVDDDVDDDVEVLSVK